MMHVIIDDSGASRGGFVVPAATYIHLALSPLAEQIYLAV